jgi:ATP/maltotriose-dependent transcriptional regulator MalT
MRVVDDHESVREWLPDLDGIELQRRYESLSKREREAMAVVALGCLNTQVGSELGRARSR